MRGGRPSEAIHGLERWFPYPRKPLPIHDSIIGPTFLSHHHEAHSAGLEPGTLNPLVGVEGAGHVARGDDFQPRGAEQPGEGARGIGVVFHEEHPHGNGTTTTTIALVSSAIYNDFPFPPSINTAGTLGFLAFLDAGSPGLFNDDDHGNQVWGRALWLYRDRPILWARSAQ